MGDDGAIRVSDYCALLRDNPRFRYLFSAYLVTNSGNWINYVAALAFIRMLLGVGADGDEAGADGSAASAPEEAALSKAGVYTAAFMFIRMLPAIALAPCVGAIAERVDKRLGLFVCDMCAATCVGGMLLLSVGLDQGREGLDGQPGVLVWPAFFILVFLQQSCAAQYDPLRSSLVPQVCLGERELKIATTVDASVWSALMAIGGAIGGFVTTRFGITTNFAVDACSYLGSAMLTLLMSAPMKPPDAAKGADDDQPGTPMSRTGSEAEGGEPDAAARPRLPYHAPLGARLCDRLCFPQYVTPPPGGEEEGDNIQPIGLYLRENPGLLLMLFAKMSGALTWCVQLANLPRATRRLDTPACLCTQHTHRSCACLTRLCVSLASVLVCRLSCCLLARAHARVCRGLAELIEVELSALPSFQLRGSWGSPSATLGLVYAATGVGALLGPLVANSCGGEGSIYMGGSERRSQFIMVIGFAIGTAVR
jgi:MFS family permease